MKRTNLLLIAAWLLTLLGIIFTSDGKKTGQLGNAETVLLIGMECDYAPNNWDEDKPSETNLPISNNMGFYAEGYDVHIAKRLGMEIEGLKLPQDGLLEALNRGQIDMVVSGMVDSKQHKQAAAFTDT